MAKPCKNDAHKTKPLNAGAFLRLDKWVLTPDAECVGAVTPPWVLGLGQGDFFNLAMD
jgi:hypothetical protein